MALATAQSAVIARSIGGRLLGVGHWNGGSIRNFPLLPFWVPIAPTVLTVGGTDRPRVRYGGRPIIGRLFFFSDKLPPFKNMAIRRRLGLKFGPKFVGILPLCKKGGNMGRMSVDIL